MRHRTFYATCSVGSTEAQLLLFLSDPSTPWHKYFTGGGTNISEAFHYPRGQHKPTRTPSLPPKKNQQKTMLGDRSGSGSSVCTIFTGSF